MSRSRLLLLVVAILAQFYSSKSCLKEEKRALLNIKDYMKFHNNSVGSNLLPSWVRDPNSDCCGWERVTCDSYSGQVIHLALYNVTGNTEFDYTWPICSTFAYSLNVSLFLSFKHLKSLNLSSNCFRGLIDIQELSPLQNLELLDLSHNDFWGPSIFQDKHSLSKLKKLRTLNLDGNGFDNDIFKPLHALPTLASLFLSLNLINGSLDDKGLCNMKQLQELDLSDNDLTGNLDACLGNLTSLRALDLSNCFLSGSIPASFFVPLASLEYLSLWHNKFEGLFSLNSLANNSKLKVLSLGDNVETFQVETENPHWIPSFQLAFLRISHCQVNLPSRTIPTFLSNQYGLKYMDLSHNNLVGMLPNYLFANKPKLETAKLSNNKFQGKLQNNLGYLLPHLEYLDFSSNMFDGEIPPSIGEMSSLKTLDLSSNNFSGKVPKQILLGCISLETLRLSNNGLQGHIFPTPINLRSLKILMMDNNQLNGTLEDGLFLVHLQVLDISNNSLSGMLPSWIFKSPPSSFLSISRNNFEGTIPKDWCTNNLSYIDLSQNRFFGTIPSCLFTSSLTLIHLRGNSLTGTIPETISRSSNLVSVDMRDNKFFGSIPKSIYGLQYLGFLLLAGNILEGQISSQICKLQRINFLDLSQNYFTGSIPSCFNNMSFGNYSFEGTSFFDDSSLVLENFYPNFWLIKVYDYYASDNEEVQLLTKSLFQSYKGFILYMISGLDLSSNQFSGEIPNQIGDLSFLYALNLSHNHLNGTIPKSFQKLKQLESLDLSNNSLKGEIPLQLQDLSFLSYFNVSYNNLSGRAPENGQFADFGESNYKGNPYLFWSNSNRRTAAQPFPQTPLNDIERSESVIDFTAFYWSFGLFYVMTLLTLVTVLWINPHWRRVWFYYITICLQRSFGQFFEDVFF